MAKLSHCYLLIAFFCCFPGTLSHAAGAPADGANWPTFHGNPHLTGSNPEETTVNARNVSRLRLKWQGLMRKVVDFSSPAVVNGVLYIGSTDGRRVGVRGIEHG